MPQDDPRPLPYLDEEARRLRAQSALDVSLEVDHSIRDVVSSRPLCFADDLAHAPQLLAAAVSELVTAVRT